jgi:hypothetical protein
MRFRTRTPLRERITVAPIVSPLAVQGFGATAGAFGGYQAAEDEDPTTRALATLGGGAAGGIFGQRVAQGKGIGPGVEDVSRVQPPLGEVIPPQQ